MKLPLQVKRSRNPHVQSFCVCIWTSSLPFVTTKSSVLIHRPRKIVQYQIGNRKSHLAIHYWCGGGTAGTKKLIFSDALADTDLMCHRCEKIAVGKGYPPTDEICGTHIHKGRVISEQMCCTIDHALALSLRAKAFDEKYGTPCEQIRKLNDRLAGRVRPSTDHNDAGIPHYPDE